MNKTMKAVVASLTLTLSPAVLFAVDELGGPDIQAGRFSVGARGMFFDPVDADEGKFHGGGQVRLHLSPAIAIEGSVDYRRHDFQQTQTKVWPVQASLLAYLMPHKPVSPFLLAGAGWYFTTVEGPGGLDETQNRFGPHVGGGIQAFLNKTWSIDATYRYVWVEDVNSKDATLLDKDYKDSGSMITAGLNYHF